MIDAMIQIAWVFALQLFCFSCGYVCGIRRGQAMELKRWRRHRPPRPDITPLPTYRPDWSPCSQPPNSGGYQPRPRPHGGTPLNPPPDSP